MFSVTLVGDETVAVRLDSLPAAILQAVSAKSALLADQLLGLAREKLSGGVLQSRSGALANSLGVDGPTIAQSRAVTTIFAGANLKYAAIQEYGGATSPHDILPSRAKALAFVSAGRQVFARLVRHPGSHLPERSYLRSSLSEMADAIDAQLSDAALAAAARELANG